MASASLQQAPGGIAHETGELHRLLVESVRDYAIFALDPQGYILSWNPGAERFKGYKAEEIVGKHFSIFYPPERVAEGFPDYELREAARTGRFEDEGWRVRKDGTRFWANVVITALRDDTGQLVGFAKVTRDLSERREAEEALRESEERFRLLVQGVKDYAIFMLDPGGRVATWNEGARRINGYSAGEILGQHFSRFFPESDIADGKPPRELEIASRTGQYAEEGWRIRKDGSRFWASVLLTAIRNREGRLVGYAKVTRDLTERRAAQERVIENARRMASEEAARVAAEEARRRSERLQSITSAFSAAHTIPEVARITFDDGMRAVAADAGALALLDAGGEHIQLAGDTGYGDLPSWTRRFSRDAAFPIAAALRTGQPVICRSAAERDARYPELAGVLSPYAAMAVLPLTARGRAVGALALHYRDAESLTEDRLSFAEAMAQQCAQALERAQLYEAEQQARARADEANRAKSQFLAAMSHELRTPLNAIAGYTELLELGISGPVTEEQRQQLQRIRRSQQHLLGIINDILNFSRIEAGQITYDFAPVPMNAVLESVGLMIAPQAAAKGQRFESSGCPPELVAWADRGKTEQIVLNLLSNAVKFTPAGGCVTLRCTSSGGHQLLITVQDTGIGIPPDQLQRIFEPFVQVGRSLTALREGTGLGLAISRDLARAMAGDIRVESTLGSGSTFTLTLPTRPAVSRT